MFIQVKNNGILSSQKPMHDASDVLCLAVIMDPKGQRWTSSGSNATAYRFLRWCSALL